MALFRKGKTRKIAIFHRAGLLICSHLREGKTPSYIAKFHGTDLVICSQFREGKTLSYSQINMVTNIVFQTEINSLTTKKQTTKYLSVNFQNILSPSYNILKI